MAFLDKFVKFTKADPKIDVDQMKEQVQQEQWRMALQMQNNARQSGNEAIVNALGANPMGWFITSCSVQNDMDMFSNPGVRGSTIELQMRVDDPRILQTLMGAIRGTMSAMSGAPMWNPNTVIAVHSAGSSFDEDEGEDKELPKGQRYVKDFGDD